MSEYSPELEKVIERVRKLQAKADSCREIGSDAEAESFAAAVQKTLAIHKLTMSDIDFDAQDEEEPVEKEDLTFGEQRGLSWRAILCQVVAKAHFCAIYTYRGSSRIALVGRASDRKIAEYVFRTLLDYATKAEAADARAGRASDRKIAEYAFRTLLDYAPKGGRGHKANFMLGFAAKIGQRYREEAAALRAEVAATGTSLVRLDSAKAAVDDYMSGQKLRTTQLRVQGHASAYAAGQRAGANARIRSNAVETSSRTLSLGA